MVLVWAAKKQTQAVGSQKVRNNHIQSRKAGAASAAFDIILHAALQKRVHFTNCQIAFTVMFGAKRGIE
jgi:peroxiredoxin family protein